jgi:hypothetical protein
MFVERNEMTEQEQAEFERKLRYAMQHRAAPLGLKQRVLARAREQRNERGRSWTWQWVAASTLLVAIVCGGLVVHQRVEERQKGEEARQQVLTALRITNKTLDRVTQRLAYSDR